MQLVLASPCAKSGGWGSSARGFGSPTPRRMRFLRRPFQISQDDRKPFVTLNAIAFGMFLIGCVLGLAFPELVQAQASGFEKSGRADLVLRVIQNPWLFALVIFGVNTLTVGAAMIVLPSMLVPFLGIVVFAWKALNIGLAIVPTTPTLWVGFIPHSLTLLIEFEAYVLLMLPGFSGGPGCVPGPLAPPLAGRPMFEVCSVSAG